ncbi:MAG: OmpA family protein [Flavobacteriales bacterium]|nr:OmpA family protein [Flavobacteriales bacterium]MBK7555770.1 OmpA family protein [Flavobacteriales bacterium]MBK9195757.1 OmpA family protein [Flavobacteriales bacterium]
MRSLPSFVPAIVLLSLFAACVPARKHQELSDRYATMQTESEANLAKATAAEAKANELQATLDERKLRSDRLQNDTMVLGTSLRTMTGQYDRINKLNNELLEKYNMLLAGDRSENRKLLTDLETMRLNLQVKEDSLTKLSQRIGEKQAQLAEREATLSALQAEIAKKDEAMKSLKERVSKALTGFEGKGLTVTQKDGKIYVNMDNKLLFATGSTVVEAKGKEALISLAKAIESEKDLNVMVEGHTDTDKVLGSGGGYKDNWDLSVLRATSVVRILQDNSKMDPLRVTAAGRGEYVPVDPADKAKNRRIEVILAPDLRELYKLVTE